MSSKKQQTTDIHQFIGVAAEDIEKGAVVLKVIALDLFPAALTGTFAPGTTTVNTSVKNINGVVDSQTVTTTNHIEATWWGERGIAYAPMIRQGEQVEIIQFANSDKYFWRSLGRDRALHQTDRLRFEVGATTGKNTEKTDLNTYFFELDSDGKVVQMKTSKVNGEPFSYTFSFNTDSGQFILSDDAGGVNNRIILDSKNKTIQLNNVSGTTIQMKDQDITVYAPRDILMHAGRQIFMDSPTITINRDSSGVVVFNAASFGVNTNSAVVTAGCFGINGASKFNGPVVMGATRVQSIVTGAVGSAYVAPTTNFNNGTSVVSSSSADSTTTSATDRYVAAQPDIASAFNDAAGYFQTIAAKIGITLDTSPMTNSAQSAKISILQGE